MSKILIVDDVFIDRKILIDMLDGYEVIEAENGTAALDIAYRHAEDISLILLDILMPALDGYEVLRRLKQDRTTRRIPVILITMLDSEFNETKGLSAGAIDYITKPFNYEVVKNRVRNQIELKMYQDSLQELVDIKAQKILKMHETLFDAVTSIVEYRNLESGRHVKRIRLYCKALLDALLEKHIYTHLIDRKNADVIARASSLHDIGKVSIPDHILLKPNKLTPSEFEVIKTHATVGNDFVDSLADTEDEDFIYYARQICRHHHEWWDGTGYLDGLKGEEIPIASRVVAIADVYDALVSKRVYKPAIPHKESAQIILNGAGTQFDPTLVAVFWEIEQSFRRISCINRDDMEGEQIS